MKRVNRLRIVVGYPIDADQGRRKVSEILSRRLFDVLRTEFLVDVEVVAWDTHASPGIHPHGAQGWIDMALEIDASDLFIAIFFRRLGTPYEKEGRVYPSGTAYEFESAISSFKKSKLPQVWLYFPEKFIDYTGALVELNTETQEYLREVKSDKERFPILYRNYSSWGQFSDLMEMDLLRFVTKAINAERSTPSATENLLAYSATSGFLVAPAECLAVPLPELEVNLTAVLQGSSPQFWNGKILIYLNTNLTAQISDDDFSTVQVVVMLTDPQTGHWRVRSAEKGMCIGVNAVAFELTIPVSPTETHIRLRVSGLTGNSNQLGISRERPTEIVAAVVVGSLSPSNFRIVPGNMSCTLARIEPTLSASIDNLVDGTAGGPSSTCDHPTGNLPRRNVIVGLKVHERLPASFVEHVLSQASRNKGNPSASAFGILVRVFGIPDGSELSVSSHFRSRESGRVWVMRGNSTQQAPERGLVDGSPSPVRLCQINVTGLSASILFDVLKGGEVFMQVADRIDFMLTVSDNQQAGASAISFAVSYWPLSTVTVPSKSEPIPRFSDTAVAYQVSL